MSSALRAYTVQPAPAHPKETQSVKFLSVLQRRKQADNDIQVCYDGGQWYPSMRLLTQTNPIWELE